MCSTLIMQKIQAQNYLIRFSYTGDTSGILCRDNDGNNYKTVKIGTQVWMAENLKTTTYNDGTPIPLVTDSSAWSHLITPGYCWYKNDAANSNTYGALYNWFTVNTGKLAPAGWHVPTDEEWITLITYLGGEKVAGGKLKETGKIFWKSPNQGAVNESGFTALPAGQRDYNGTFSVMGKDGFWWSVTEYGTTGKVWYRSLDYNYAGVLRVSHNKKNGFSIRCIQDAISTNQPPATKTKITDTIQSVPVQLQSLNPSGFTATRIANGDVILKWNSVQNAATYYLQGPGVHPGVSRPGVEGQPVYVNGTSYIVKGLQAGTHSWGLFTMYIGPSGLYYADELNPSITNLSILANPTGFRAVRQANGDVILSWNSVPNAMNYNLQGPGVQQGLLRPGAVVNNTVNITGTTYTVKGLKAGTHSWVLFAVYSAPNGPYFGDELNPTKTSLTIAVTPQLSATLTAKWTSFDPATQGFRFSNTFRNNVIGPPINMETGGLCGGMSYTVLDYYNAGRPIPNQTYRPANNTQLQSYIYNRQVNSLASNLDKWLEISVNPFGARTTEFFNWGINQRLQELMSFIDRGVPVQLGLKGSEGTLNHDHQVLAIGYDVGRYKYNPGNFKEDIRIYVFDPNYPAQTLTLLPNSTANEYFYLENPDDRWRTYFVDNRYSFVNPPVITNPVYTSDGLIHELLFNFSTGADDMRGGPDHADVTVRMKDNTSQYYPNVSQNGRWLPNYIETAQVVLSQPIAQGMISSIEVSTNAANNITGDNWDLLSVEVKAIIGGYNGEMQISSGGPWRFTGARIPLVIDVK